MELGGKTGLVCWFGWLNWLYWFARSKEQGAWSKEQGAGSDG